MLIEFLPTGEHLESTYRRPFHSFQAWNVLEGTLVLLRGFLPSGDFFRAPW